MTNYLSRLSLKKRSKSNLKSPSTNSLVDGETNANANTNTKMDTDMDTNTNHKNEMEMKPLTLQSEKNTKKHRQKQDSKKEKDYDWFEQLFGFKEKKYSYQKIQKHQFKLEGGQGAKGGQGDNNNNDNNNNSTLQLVSIANGRRFQIGKFETPSLEKLNQRLLDLVERQKEEEEEKEWMEVIANTSNRSIANGNDNGNDNATNDNDTTNDNTNNQKLTFETKTTEQTKANTKPKKEGISFQHLIGDVQKLYQNPQNKGSIFQVSSNFNCLNMSNPKITPKHGITNYIVPVKKKKEKRDDKDKDTCDFDCDSNDDHDVHIVDDDHENENQNQNENSNNSNRSNRNKSSNRRQDKKKNRKMKKMKKTISKTKIQHVPQQQQQQGPLSSICCAPATIYRNYFVQNQKKEEYDNGDDNDNNNVDNIDHIVQNLNDTPNNITSKRKKKKKKRSKRKSTSKSTSKQINNAKDVGTVFRNEQKKYWKMKNGFLLPTNRHTMHLLKREIYCGGLMSMNAKNKLSIGVQWDTEVVNFDDCNGGRNGDEDEEGDGNKNGNGDRNEDCDTNTISSNSKQHPQDLQDQDQHKLKDITTENQRPPETSPHTVTQVFSSALPITYATGTSKSNFEPFAKLVLDATYQATFAVAAIKALEKNQRVNLYLTKVGGGVFGNKSRWIVDAIRKAMNKYDQYPINVYLVHYEALEQAFFQGLKEKSSDVNACTKPFSGLSKQLSLISDYISSNINVAKLKSSYSNLSSMSPVSSATSTSTSTSNNTISTSTTGTGTVKSSIIIDETSASNSSKSKNGYLLSYSVNHSPMTNHGAYKNSAYSLPPIQHPNEEKGNKSEENGKCNKCDDSVESKEGESLIYA